MPWKPYMSLYGPTFHVTPVDLCIIFQCNLYKSCIMSCGNKIVSNYFIVSMSWAWPGTSDLSVAASLYDILLWSETLVSDMRHVSQFLVPGFGRCVLLCRGRIRTRWVWSISPTQVWVWLLRNAGFSVFVVRQNLYVFNRYRNPDLDDRIFDCLLTSMNAVQAENACASFLFVGNLNGLIRSGWVLHTTTNRHGVAAFDFATVSC